MGHDDIYKKNERAWGEGLSEPSRLTVEYLSPPARILDVGCGQGKDSIALARLGYEVDALEQSPDGIDRLKEVIATEGIRDVGPIQADMLRYEIGIATTRLAS